MLNNVCLQGRLTRDPELRTTQSGIAVCSFTVANSEKYNDVERKLFLDCTAWRGTGELVKKYFQKGQEIIVRGKIWNDDYEDREGNKRTKIKCTVDEVHFCGPKANGAEGSNSIPAAAGKPVDVAFDDIDDESDLPF